MDPGTAAALAAVASIALAIGAAWARFRRGWQEFAGAKRAVPIARRNAYGLTTTLLRLLLVAGGVMLVVVGLLRR